MRMMVDVLCGVCSSGHIDKYLANDTIASRGEQAIYGSLVSNNWIKQEKLEVHGIWKESNPYS